MQKSQKTWEADTSREQRTFEQTLAKSAADYKAKLKVRVPPSTASSLAHIASSRE